MFQKSNLAKHTFTARNIKTGEIFRSINAIELDFLLEIGYILEINDDLGYNLGIINLAKERSRHHA